jgi:hypothetical protein
MIMSKCRDAWAGFEELERTLPGPGSPSCTAKFAESDFHSADMWWEIHFKKDTQSAIMEFIGPFFSSSQFWSSKPKRKWERERNGNRYFEKGMYTMQRDAILYKGSSHLVLAGDGKDLACGLDGEIAVDVQRNFTE